MNIVACDLCKEEIVGEYKQVYNSHTEGIAKQKDFGKVDVCMKCWKVFTGNKRLPLIRFPNSEVENE